MKFILSLCVALVLQPAFAKDKLIIVAERSTVMGLEQTGIVIEENKVRFTANSNFLYKKFPYPIGVFEAPVTNRVKNLTRGLTAPESIKETSSQSPHGLKIYINGKQVSHESKKVARVLSLVEVIANENLKVKGGILLKSQSDFEKINCTKTTEKVCEFKFGYLHK